MSRKRGKRRITLCATVTTETYDKIIELCDKHTDGIISRMIEKLIDEYWEKDNNTIQF